MSYWSEFRGGWRALLAATIGLASGFSATGVITSIMASHFLPDLHWTPSEFAKVGALSIFLVVCVPIAGRLTDVWGVRRTAAIGVISLPLCMLTLSQMTGDIRQYYAIFIVQNALGIMTTATVYGRVVVASFERARGLALAISVSAPAVTGIVAGFLLNPYVDNNGWRAGYQVVALCTFIGGVIALFLLPSPKRELAGNDAGPAVIKAPRRRSWADYPLIFRTRSFWILIIAMILCNLYQTLVLTQINMVILANGVDKLLVGGIISAFSFAMLVGRFVCGAAIDRFPARIVCMLGMAMPSIGLYLLASGYDSYAVVLTAMLFVGLAVGAEGDLIGVIVSRAFGVGVYGSVMGMVVASISLSSATGALLLSYLLGAKGNYDIFLWITGTTGVIGSLMFLLLPKAAVARPDETVAATAH